MHGCIQGYAKQPGGGGDSHMENNWAARRTSKNL